MVGLLVGLPVGSWVTGSEFPLLLGIPMVISGVSVLRALVPRRERFDPPGPELTRETQPELMAVVEDVARAVGHPMPDATYLEADANAGVTEVGRPRRRILVLGLPLLELLSVDQLRAVLAHEFGHYVGGDTRVGTWVYRTRETVLRTVRALSDDNPADDGIYRRLVRAPFVGYAMLFLRITAAVSRRQEYAADAVAVRTAGRDAHVGALRRVAAGGPAFEGFWRTELVPALEAGVRPPIGEGFRLFLSAGLVDAQVDQILEESLEDDRHDPYDSHPTLRQRLDALGASPEEDPPAGGPPASTLLRDHAELERRLLVALAGEETLELREAGWDEVGAVWLESYRDLVARFGSILDGRRVGESPALVADLAPLAERLRELDDGSEEGADFAARAFNLVAAALSVALVRDGFALESPVGEPVRCARGETTFVPFADLGRIAAGDEPPDALTQRLAAAGVADAPLVTAGAPAPA